MIIITAYDEVEKTIATQAVAAVLSIEHPGVMPGQVGAAPRLTATPQKILTFWDIEKPAQQAPDAEQIEAGLAFAMEHITQGPVLIHCKAGKARSAGMALGVLSLLYPHETPLQLIERLIEIRPQAGPNILVVEIVDRLTGRNGTLLQAVLDHPVMQARRAETENARQWWIQKNPDVARQMFPEKFNNPPSPPSPSAPEM